MNNYLEQILNNTKDLILKDIDLTEKEEILNGYKKYLIIHYAETFEEIEEKDAAVKVFSDVEIKNWINSSKEEKERLLIEDKSLDNLRYLSSVAQKYAISRLTKEMNQEEYIPEISEEKANELIIQMESESKLVRPFNQNIASTLLSEGTVDAMYSAKLTDNMSFRTSHLK